MFGLFKRQKAHKDPGAATDEQFIVPADLNQAHTYVAPGASKYPSPPVYGAQPYATQLGTDLPSIANQDAILVHYLQPPPGQDPARWYADRNMMKLRVGLHEELFQTRDWNQVAEKANDAVQPWKNTPVSTRPTSTHSPSDFRFVRPFDQRWNRELDGHSGSMAAVGMAYPIGGMQAPRSFRNTFRMQPPARDTEAIDLAGTVTAAAAPAVYVSPQAPNTERRWGL